MPSVLVVDDEPAVRESLRMLLKRECDVEMVADVDAALTAITRSPPDLVLLDVAMPGRSGLDLIPEIQALGLDVPVIVLTASNTVTVAVQAMKLGAADFLTKPFEVETLRIRVRKLLEQGQLAREVVRLRDEVADRQVLGAMVGRSPVMRDVFRSVERLAASDATILISGESGTGKELAARAIHDLSPRATGPFVPVNCSAIPAGLIESELFGHEKGAFTGASQRRIGRFEAASGGTLLLDEIGELDPSVQVKLLRALQERVIERVGSSDPFAVDVRVLAASNRNLEDEVAAGRFREDLFYRINVVPLRMPSLRERREDVPLLATTFIERAKRRARDAGRDAREVTISREAMTALEGYAWPGNVRELENAIEHGLAMAESDEIELPQLPLAVRRTGRAEALREAWRQGRLAFEDVVERFESELLRESLERAEWNQTHAAGDLGITRRVLKLKMDRFGIKPPD